MVIISIHFHPFTKLYHEVVIVCEEYIDMMPRYIENVDTIISAIISDEIQTLKLLYFYVIGFLFIVFILDNYFATGFEKAISCRFVPTNKSCIMNPYCLLFVCFMIILVVVRNINWYQTVKRNRAVHWF